MPPCGEVGVITSFVGATNIKTSGTIRISTMMGISVCNGLVKPTIIMSGMLKNLTTSIGINDSYIIVLSVVGPSTIIP